MKWVISCLVFLFAAGQAGAQQPDTARIVTLQPGDLIRVEIWREPDLSGDFMVDQNGVVTLPLLGEKPVSSIPIEQLRDVLTDEYRKQLRNPSIVVVPIRKLLVLGEVRNPGPYDVNPIETVIGVIALAGGIDTDGNLDRVSVVREGRVLIDQVPPGSTVGSVGLLSGDQIVVGQRSWLARNQSLVISVLLALPSAIFTVTRIIE